MGNGKQPEERRREPRPGGRGRTWPAPSRVLERIPPDAGNTKAAPPENGSRGRLRMRRTYFLMGRGGWNFFIQASWTIIMTWLVDQ